MKTKLQKIGEDLIPLSRRQSFLLYLLIVCLFEFLFFFTPALANASITDPLKDKTETQDDLISLSLPLKSSELDSEAQNIINHLIANPGLSPEPVKEEKALRLANPQVISDQNNNQPEEEIKYRVIKTSEHIITAYNSEAAQTDSSPCITANGFNVCEHGIEDTIGANFLKLGTKVRIPELFGDQVFVVRDRMNKRFSNRVDVWMVEKKDALKFGVKTAKIEVLEEI
jgi:3D (Asp-Asp-Asp) domain-containing protein